jgi:hypothetical protein
MESLIVFLLGHSPDNGPDKDIIENKMSFILYYLAIRHTCVISIMFVILHFLNLLYFSQIYIEKDVPVLSNHLLLVVYHGDCL